MSNGSGKTIFIVEDFAPHADHQSVPVTMWHQQFRDHALQWGLTEEMYFTRLFAGRDDVTFVKASDFDGADDGDEVFYWVACNNAEWSTSPMWVLFLNDKIKNLIREDKISILVTQTLEPYPDASVAINYGSRFPQMRFEEFTKQIGQLLGCNPKIVFLIANTFSLSDWGASYKARYHRAVMIKYPMWEYYARHAFVERSKFLFKTISPRGTIRERMQNATREYMCLNNYPRFHRVATVHALHYEGIAYRGHISYNDPAPKMSKYGIQLQLGVGGYSENLSKYMSENPILKPIRVIDDQPIKGSMPWGYWYVSRRVLDDTWLSLTTEAYDVCGTHVNDVLMPTEKIYRDIFLKRPFIVMGPYRFLHALRSNGYQTFSTFWSEDYDSIEMLSGRLEGVMQNMKRLDELKEAVLTRADEMDQILDRNLQTFLSKQHDERVLNLLHEATRIAGR